MLPRACPPRSVQHVTADASHLIVRSRLRTPTSCPLTRRLSTSRRRLPAARRALAMRVRRIATMRARIRLCIGESLHDRHVSRATAAVTDGARDRRTQTSRRRRSASGRARREQRATVAQRRSRSTTLSDASIRRVADSISGMRPLTPLAAVQRRLGATVLQSRAPTDRARSSSANRRARCSHSWPTLDASSRRTRLVVSSRA